MRFREWGATIYGTLSTFFLTQHMPSLNAASLTIALTFFSFLVASYAVLLSAFLPLSAIPVLDVLAQDTHYKYFALLLIPTSAYFVIANWVGWQYYQNS